VGGKEYDLQGELPSALAAAMFSGTEVSVERAKALTELWTQQHAAAASYNDRLDSLAIETGLSVKDTLEPILQMTGSGVSGRVSSGQTVLDAARADIKKYGPMRGRAGQSGAQRIYDKAVDLLNKEEDRASRSADKAADREVRAGAAQARLAQKDREIALDEANAARLEEYRKELIKNQRQGLSIKATAAGVSLTPAAPVEEEPK
jgi:hypothetical protein